MYKAGLYEGTIWRGEKKKAIYQPRIETAEEINVANTMIFDC